MNKHALHYIQLNPEPVHQEEPSAWTIWAGAACLAAGVYLVTFLAFTL